MNYNEYISYSNIAFGSNEFVRSLEYAKKAITENPDAVQGYLCTGKLIFKDLFPDGVTVDISDFTNVRGNKYVMNPRSGITNFSQANQMLQSKYNVSLSQLEDMLSKKFELPGFKLTWHEDLNLKTLIPLPTVLHGPSKTPIAHTGGIALFDFMLPRITNTINNTTKVEIPNIIESIIESFQQLAPSH